MEILRQSSRDPRPTTVIYCDDTVVGFFGILAARFVVDGKDVLAGQGVDIAIDEPHRRLDLFIRLLKEIESRSGQREYNLTTEPLMLILMN